MAWRTCFCCPDFAPTATGSQQRILGKEFNHFIKQLELRGARVVFVADTCHGGGMARDIDPRAEEMSFRQVPSYQAHHRYAQAGHTNAEAFMTELDFDRTEFLAAVDRKTKSPEISIPGIPGLRGALSYAVARALEGNADANNDGKVTVKELFTNVRQMVYQLSNQRQNIVTVSSPSRNLDTDTVFEFTRGVSVVEPTAAASQPTTVVGSGHHRNSAAGAHASRHCGLRAPHPACITRRRQLRTSPASRRATRRSKSSSRSTIPISSGIRLRTT